jgi:hypothetical protein
MKTLETMTKDEKSLLLFFETCAVDHAGKVRTAHMNDDDRKIVERWTAEGFVRYGRVASEGCNEYGTHWCHLSDEAWALAHAERKARAARVWLKRTWRTTEEKRAAA